MHFGIVSPPVPGHIHPFGALGRELIARGHRVTLLHMQDVEPRAHAEGLEFVPLGLHDFPSGWLPASLAKLGTLDGTAALRFTIGEVRKTTEMFLRYAPEAISRAGIDALLVDQTEPAGCTLAEHAGIPFITVANALMLNEERSVPPAFTDWKYSVSPLAQVRNRIGYGMSHVALRSVRSTVARYRRDWALPAHANPEDTFSKLLQISQQCPAFDYPRHSLPETFHYTGPLRRAYRDVAFPWDRLDGRPLVYASLGTLQNGKEAVFRTFAEACAPLDVQLVITHGGGLSEDVTRTFAGQPIVVSYAPQLQVLSRAALTLTHAGLNTMLDSLSCGVPLVAVPITYEQPAIAQRMVWCGAGVALKLRQLSIERLRASIREVLGNPAYRDAAARVRTSIQQCGGVARAADLIEGALSYELPMNIPARNTKMPPTAT